MYGKVDMHKARAATQVGMSGILYVRLFVHMSRRWSTTDGSTGSVTGMVH